MKKLLCLVALAGVPVGLLVATPAQANAAIGYGAFTVRNSNTSVAIAYQVKWGDGQWQNSLVQPGQSMSHWHPLDGNGQVPRPSIRFDYVAGDNQVTLKTYDLEVYATFNPYQGKRHVFRYSSSGIYLDLYTE